MTIGLEMSQWKLDENNKYERTGFTETGSYSLLKIGDKAGNKEGIVVSMLPNG